MIVAFPGYLHLYFSLLLRFFCVRMSVFENVLYLLFVVICFSYVVCHSVIVTFPGFFITHLETTTVSTI